MECASSTYREPLLVVPIRFKCTTSPEYIVYQTNGDRNSQKQHLDFDRLVTPLAPEHKGNFSFSAGDAVGSHFLDSRIFASVLCQMPLQLCPLLLCTRQCEDMRNEMTT